ncbi:MAG: Holliday junction resolvase RuvX [Clostridia bacterium]|nr:Holliday junction resolvase RuvX [Clostridia bacterium]
MRVLGIDYGDVRTGLAISDPLMFTAQGLESVKHGNNEKMLLHRIGEIIKEYSVELIVIGFPLNMNATKGPRVEKTEKFIEKLEKTFGLKVEKIDERLTTVSAHRTMTELGVSKDKKKNLVDTIAATYILQTYLDKK